MEKVFEANNIDVLDSSRFYLRRKLEKYIDYIKYIKSLEKIRVFGEEA